jgi:nitrate reductase NapAB chaperone NapD
MKDRAKEYPKVIKELRKHGADLKKADENVQKMIADLKKMTDQMDINSDYHAELGVFTEEVGKLIAEVKAKDIPELTETLEGQLQTLQGIERRRSAAVVQARNTIRGLEDQQGKLVLIIKVGKIEAAIKIFESSLGQYESLVGTAKNVLDETAAAVSTP